MFVDSPNKLVCLIAVENLEWDSWMEQTKNLLFVYRPVIFCEFGDSCIYNLQCIYVPFVIQLHLACQSPDAMTACSHFMLVAVHQHGPCHSCNLVWDVCDMLSGIMLLLTQPVIDNYEKYTGSKLFQLVSHHQVLHTHIRMCVCMYVHTFVYWRVQYVLATWLKGLNS